MLMDIQFLMFDGFEVLIFFLKSFFFSFLTRSTYLVRDQQVIARNSSFAILTFDRSMSGVLEYLCQAVNKHGVTKIFIHAVIPSSVFFF